MEEKKLKKEYCIYCIYNRANPFILNTYSSFEEAKIKLYEIILQEEARNRIYYVDNDFFKNKYNPNVLGKYFCIKERCISEWEIYKESKRNSSKNGKILMFRQIV